MPRVGTPLVFATVDADGRVALVRTGPLERFATDDGTPRVRTDGAREDEAVSTMRAGLDDARDLGSRDTDVVTLRPSLIPSLVPPTLAWGTPRPVDVAIADFDDESDRDTLDLVESIPFSLRRRVSEIVPRGTADDEAPATERVQERAV